MTRKKNQVHEQLITTIPPPRSPETNKQKPKTNEPNPTQRATTPPWLLTIYYPRPIESSAIFYTKTAALLGIHPYFRIPFL